MPKLANSLHDYMSQMASERKAKREKVQLDIGIDGETDSSTVDIITFAEAKWGLNQKLWPTQKAILKCFYQLDLDDTEKTVPIREYPNPETIEYLTEKGFIAYLKDKGYANIDPENIHDARQLVLVMGRRSSKTFMSSLIICYTLYRLIMLSNPQARFHLPPGEKIVIANVASTKEQAGILFNMIINHVSNSSFFAQYTDDVLKTTINMFTPWDLQQKHVRPSITIKAMACSAKSIRGSGTIIAVLDELAHFDETGGPASDDKIYTAFSPSIVTFGNAGRIISISSPLGESGILHKMFTDGVVNGNKTYMCVQLPTWVVNPTIPMEVLKEMESGDPDNFYAEYGASFLSATSRSYIPKRHFITDAVDTGRKSSILGSNFSRYYMAVDVAFVKDGFAICIVHPEESKIIVDYSKAIFPGEYPYERLDKLDPEEMAEYTAGVYNAFKPIAAVMDQWESYSFASLLSNHDVEIERVPFDRTHNSELYQRFRNRLYQGNLRLPDEPALIKELTNLRVSSAAKYSMSVQAPSGGHDDLADSLVRACWLCERDFFDPHERGHKAVSTSISVSTSRRTTPNRRITQRDAMYRRKLPKIRSVLKR